MTFTRAEQLMILVSLKTEYNSIEDEYRGELSGAGFVRNARTEYLKRKSKRQLDLIVRMEDELYGE